MQEYVSIDGGEGVTVVYVAADGGAADRSTACAVKIMHDNGRIEECSPASLCARLDAKWDALGTDYEPLFPHGNHQWRPPI